MRFGNSMSGKKFMGNKQMIDYAQSIIDIRKSINKFEDFANKKQWNEAQIEVLKLKSSVTVLNKILKDDVPKR